MPHHFGQRQSVPFQRQPAVERRAEAAFQQIVTNRDSRIRPGVAAVEDGALGRELVEHRGLNRPVAVGADAVVAPGIVHDDHDVHDSPRSGSVLAQVLLRNLTKTGRAPVDLLFAGEHVYSELGPQPGVGDSNTYIDGPAQ